MLIQIISIFHGGQFQMNRINIIPTSIFTCLFLLLLTFPTLSQTDIVYNYSTLDQPVNDLIYGKEKKLIYASVPSTGGIYGNHIIAINPFTKQIVNSVFVGSEPNKLAISDDEQFLYVGLDGSAQIRKVILSSFTADIVFGLGNGSSGFLYPEDIVVLPNNPHSIAVSRRYNCCSPRHQGVAIYDNGVKRPNETPGHVGSNRIEAGENEGIIYGFDNESSESGFRRMSIDSNGVTITLLLRNAIGGSEIKYSNGRIYSNTGFALNIKTNSLDGTFAVQGFSNGVAPDAKSKRVFFIQSNTLKAFNTENFQPTGSVNLNNSSHNTSQLIRWGRRGLAYRTNDNKVAIFQTSFVPAQPNTSDFDGDERADFAVFRPSTSGWFSTTGIYDYQFGLSTDIPVAADYDGDNKTDIAVYRNGIWYILKSSDQSFTTLQFGLSNDIPISKDFDGDHKADFAVYRNGTWYILRSSNQQVEYATFGLPDDVPIPADFDGDGRTDFAVFRPSDGGWHILNKVTNQYSALQFGISSAQPVPADYDGDGKADIAVWQNTFGTHVYYVLQSSNNNVREFLLDNLSDSVAFPMDTDGDGKFNPTVFSSNGIWTFNNSKTNQIQTFQFGSMGDMIIH